MTDQIQTQYIKNPWYFDGEVFEGPVDAWAGFVYEITDKENGKKYIGKKFFWNMRKDPKTGKRKKTESDWKRYYGSNTFLKQLVKERGKDSFLRTIISLHQLKRDVNYMEVKLQYVYSVLEAVDPADNEMMFMNGNIGGRHWSHLVRGIWDRTKLQSSNPLILLGQP